MKTELDHLGLFSHPNVRAFSHVVRHGESNHIDEDAHHGSPHSAYRAMYHPHRRKWWEGPLTGPHPNALEPLPDGSGRMSSAFGAYQVVRTTLRDKILARYEGVEDDIRPAMQDAWFICLVHYQGALDDVLDGRLDEALAKCRDEWASLPDSTLDDGGSKVSMAVARQVWKDYGGHVPHVVALDPSDRPDPAPITEASDPDGDGVPGVAGFKPPKEEAVAPFIPLVIPLLQSLISGFVDPLVRAKVGGFLTKQNVDPAAKDQIVGNLMGIVNETANALAGQAPTLPVSATPSAVADPVVAIAAVKSNPAALAQVEQRMSDYLDQLAPMLDQLDKLERGAWSASEESMDRAANRATTTGNDDWMAKALVIGILVAAATLIMFIGGVAIAQIVSLQSRTPTTEVWAAITGVIGTVLGILGTVFAYRFGTSRTSQTKDFAIAELSQRRKV